MLPSLLELTKPAGHFATTKAQLGNAVLTLEVLRKPEDHQKGFMFREPPDDSSGLLFLYSYGGRRSFWMKNVHFDLDLISLDDQGRVRQIDRLKAFDLRSVEVRFPCNTCIEVAAGFCSRHNVHIGSQLILGST